MGYLMTGWGTNPIPLPASPLKGEENVKSAIL